MANRQLDLGFGTGVSADLGAVSGSATGVLDAGLLGAALGRSETLDRGAETETEAGADTGAWDKGADVFAFACEEDAGDSTGVDWRHPMASVDSWGRAE